MNELLQKTQEEIELTLLDGLFQYLKEHKYFERKDFSEDAKNYLLDYNLSHCADYHIFDTWLDVKDYCENTYCPTDFYDEDELAKALEEKGWRTLNKEENLKPNDLFTDDEIEKYISDNYTIENLVANGVIDYRDVSAYVVNEEQLGLLDYFGRDVVGYVRDNYELEDLLEWK